MAAINYVALIHVGSTANHCHSLSAHSSHHFPCPLLYGYPHLSHICSWKRRQLATSHFQFLKPLLKWAHSGQTDGWASGRTGEWAESRWNPCQISNSIQSKEPHAGSCCFSHLLCGPQPQNMPACAHDSLLTSSHMSWAPVSNAIRLGCKMCNVKWERANELSSYSSHWVIYRSQWIICHNSGFIICFRLSLCLSLSQFTWHCIASGRLVVYVICWPAASTQCAPFLFILMTQQLRPKINWIAKTFNTFRCKQEICQKSEE